MKNLRKTAYLFLIAYHMRAATAAVNSGNHFLTHAQLKKMRIRVMKARIFLAKVAETDGDLNSLDKFVDMDSMLVAIDRRLSGWGAREGWVFSGLAEKGNDHVL